MQIIWRVENNKEFGAYSYRGKNTLIYNLYEKHADHCGTHPQLIDERGIQRNNQKGEICGFKNITQAKKWFSKNDLKILKLFGYILKKIKVKKIIAIGERQVLAVK